MKKDKAIKNAVSKIRGKYFALNCPTINISSKLCLYTSDNLYWMIDDALSELRSFTR